MKHMFDFLGNSVGIPMWLFYGVIFGGFVPTFFGVQFFWSLIGMFIGPVVFYVIYKKYGTSTR